MTTTTETRRELLTLEAAIRFARVTAQVAKSPKRRAEATARLAELEADMAKTRENQ